MEFCPRLSGLRPRTERRQTFPQAASRPASIVVDNVRQVRDHAQELVHEQEDLCKGLTGEHRSNGNDMQARRHGNEDAVRLPAHGGLGDALAVIFVA